MTSNNRLAGCGVRKIAAGPIRVVLRNGRPVALGVQLCGLVWLCAVCATRERERLRRRLERAMRVWMRSGGAVIHLTVAPPHSRGESLASRLDLLRQVYDVLQAGSAQVRFRARWGVKFVGRVTETTWEQRNSWHAHLHIVLFLQAALSAEEVRDLEEDIHVRLRRRLPATFPGARAHPAVTCVPVHDPAAVAWYLTKPQYGPRRPGQVTITPLQGLDELEAHRNGCVGCAQARQGRCPRARALASMWAEFEATVGRRHWFGLSPRLEERIAQLDGEAADGGEEMAREVVDVPVCELSNQQWRALKRAGDLPAFMAAAREGSGAAQTVLDGVCEGAFEAASELSAVVALAEHQRARRPEIGVVGADARVLHVGPRFTTGSPGEPGRLAAGGLRARWRSMRRWIAARWSARFTLRRELRVKVGAGRETGAAGVYQVVVSAREARESAA